MLNYEYLCRNCKQSCIIRQSIKDNPIKKCPNCKALSLERLISGGSDILIKVEATTLGLISQRNTEKMGKSYELQEKRHEIKQRTKRAHRYTGKLVEGASQLEKPPDDYKPFWRKDKIDTSLADLKGPALDKYLLTGKKPMSSGDN